MELLQIKDISFKYEHGNSDIFTEISFEIKKGGIFYLLGPNGTGKSTLLKCLSGVLKINNGHILLEGRDIRSFGPSDLAKKMAFVPQSQLSPFPYTVRDIVVMGRSPHISIMGSPSRADYRIADTALDSAGMLKLANRPCTELSGGEWQLVMIARALAQESEIMLLDEPTSHLDLGNQIRILNVIQDLSDRGFTIIVATHFPDHAFINSNTTAIMKNRKLMAMGATEKVISEANMKEAYGVAVRILNIENGINRRVCVPVLK